MKKFNFYTGRCSSEICEDRQFYFEQHRVMRNVLPRVYGLIMLTSLILLVFFDAGTPDFVSVYLPAVLLIVCIPRLHYWLHDRKKFDTYTFEQVKKDLARVVYLTPVLAIGFASMGVLSYVFGRSDDYLSVMFFVWSVGLVVAFSLVALPVVAISLVFLITAPLIGVFLYVGGADYHALATIYAAISLFSAVMIIGLFESFKDMAISKSDIFEKNQLLILARQEVVTAATTDPQTGLPNRNKFQELVDERIVQSGTPNRRFLVGLIAIGGLKRVSSLVGHRGRDEVVCRVAERLRAALGNSVIVARHRSDEFAVLIDDIDGSSRAIEVGSLIRNVIAIPIEQNGSSMILSVAVGFAYSNRSNTEDDSLIELASFALYEAWEKSDRKIAVFEHETREHYRRRAALEQALGLAIKNDEFNIVFQPIFNIENKKIVACEALARWSNEKIGQVRPDEFIKIAEKTGEIANLTELLLFKAASIAATWPTDIVLSFNFSASLFADRSVGLKILSILAKSGLSPHRLELEITETAAIANSTSAAKIIRSMQHAGVKIALDDFGTGYASLSQLVVWPLDKIKIDKSLIDGIVESDKKRNMLCGVLEMILALNIPCVLEGVETKEQLNLIKQMPCKYVQGYYFAKPSKYPLENKADAKTGSLPVANRRVAIG